MASRCFDQVHNQDLIVAVAEAIFPLQYQIRDRDMSQESLIHRRDAILGRNAQLFYDEPLNLVKGRGVSLWDAEGRRYVDLYNNVPGIGHGHPRVAEALRRQQGQLNVSSRFVTNTVVEYAERLVGLHSDGIESLIFSCSGTEANEIALRMARATTGQQGIVCTDSAYHGNSTEVSKLAKLPARDSSRGPFRSFPYPQKFSPEVRAMSNAQRKDLYLAELQTAIRGLELDGFGLAALILCPIFANEGVPEVPDGFLKEAFELVRMNGGLVISDEVQSGFGRSGSWWGYQICDEDPDIVSMGKAIGNGVPFAATGSSHDYVSKFREKLPYFNSVAGTPLQAAVGSVVLDVMDEESLVEKARDTGRFLVNELQTVVSGSSVIADVRGQGTFIALEVVKRNSKVSPDPDLAGFMVNSLKSKGFLVGSSGPDRNLIKLRPPLVFGKSEACDFVSTFASVHANVAE
jgi:4-aminobutyrate aminotransferase-like enzyme